MHLTVKRRSAILVDVQTITPIYGVNDLTMKPELIIINHRRHEIRVPYGRRQVNGH